MKGPKSAEKLPWSLKHVKMKKIIKWKNSTQYKRKFVQLELVVCWSSSVGFDRKFYFQRNRERRLEYSTFLSCSRCATLRTLALSPSLLCHWFLIAHDFLFLHQIRLLAHDCTELKWISSETSMTMATVYLASLHQGLQWRSAQRKCIYQLQRQSSLWCTPTGTFHLGSIRSLVHLSASARLASKSDQSVHRDLWMALAGIPENKCGARNRLFPLGGA